MLAVQAVVGDMHVNGQEKTAQNEMKELEAKLRAALESRALAVGDLDAQKESAATMMKEMEAKLVAALESSAVAVADLGTAAQTIDILRAEVIEARGTADDEVPVIHSVSSLSLSL